MKPHGGRFKIQSMLRPCFCCVHCIGGARHCGQTLPWGVLDPAQCTYEARSPSARKGQKKEQQAGKESHLFFPATITCCCVEIDHEWRIELYITLAKHYHHGLADVIGIIINAYIISMIIQYIF